MTRVRRLAFLCATCLGVLALLAPGPPPEGEPVARLRAMPVEERVRLAGKLKEFDGLPRGEQEAVRRLDRAIAAEPPENQEVYYAVLRRYHLWLRRLTDAERAELAAAPPQARLSLVMKLVADRKPPKRPDPLLDQVADFGGISPYDLAFFVKVWLRLTPQEKATFAALPDAEKRRAQLLDYNRFYHVEPVPRPGRDQIEAAYERAVTSRPRPLLKKAEEKQQQRVKTRLGEYSYLAEHPPKKVAPDKMFEFDKALPAWLRVGIDDVPPDEARWLLAHLYRLVFPYPQELEPAKAAPAKPAGAGAVPPKGPAPKKAAGAPAKAAGPATPY